MHRNEVTVYLANIKNADYRSLYEADRNKLEPRRILRIEKTLNEGQRKQLVCTGVLLNRVLGSMKITSDKIYYGPSDKPELKGINGVYFNISHSGDYVLLALGGQPLGADIQKTVAYKESLISRICGPEERTLIGSDLVKHLNRVWAVKESYTKLTGDGISKDLKDITYEAADESLLVYDKGVEAARGSVVFSDEIYEGVVLARTPFNLTNVIKFDL